MSGTLLAEERRWACGSSAAAVLGSKKGYCGKEEQNLLLESTEGEQKASFHLNEEQDVLAGQEERICKGESLVAVNKSA
ncbi:hypothetical protein AV530_011177 [Patagioenas fasciata monilis]|uniref:Uncharacterized protein n=1 Tax=Patagioenas fasciata monilis TaxID=372326 RepID=A0A1V4JQ51_PATFA|nr:hypothetical protein AV530_011177 [Patagioenas fasciata monilis]